MPASRKTRMALARDARVGVLHGGDDPRDAAGDDGVDAGRSRAMMRAGLQRHVKRRAARGFAGGGEGDRLGVRARPPTPSSRAR